MKKKRIVSLAAALVLATSVFGLTGCGKSAAANGELNIFTWTEYVPESVIEKFEKEYDIKVNWTTFSSNEDMLAKVKSEAAGTYDIVQPSDYMVEQMIAQGMLKELDKDVIKNIENIGSSYLDPSYDPGNVYSVPYQGGIAAIAVNTDKVDVEITGYDDLFDPALAGKLEVLDDYRAVIGMTARSMGYSMNETDKDKLAEIEAKLLTLKDNVKVYDSDSPKNALISGDCTVAYCWAAEIALAMEENPSIQIVFPEEGPYVFMDNWTVLKDAKNSENAMKFINFMLDPEVSQMVSAEFPYLNPNEKAVAAMGSEFSDNKAKNPPLDVIASGEYVSNLDTDTLAVYDEMWTKLKQ
ncbi:MAG: PotD/PotF family extracellular solute-binding protein [Butyrivibrio sp.]